MSHLWTDTSSKYISLSAVYDDLDAFTVGKRPEDDITLVIIKVEEGSE